VFPVFRFTVQVHDGDDENVVRTNFVEDAIRKTMDQMGMNFLLDQAERLGSNPNVGSGCFDFLTKLGSKAILL
jgi:hypothetical protein